MERLCHTTVSCTLAATESFVCLCVCVCVLFPLHRVLRGSSINKEAACRRRRPQTLWGHGSEVWVTSRASQLGEFIHGKKSSNTTLTSLLSAQASHIDWGTPPSSAPCFEDRRGTSQLSVAKQRQGVFKFSSKTSRLKWSLTLLVLYFGAE